MSLEVEQKNLAGLWMAAARTGDFLRAWAIADRALALRGGATCWHLPRHEQWVWDGRPLVGRRVLVRCYHGLGDTIQYARFLPQLARLAREVVVWAQPALLGLLRTLPAKLELLPLHDGTPETDYDVDLEIMELAHVLRVTLASLPNRVPYFAVPPAHRYTAAFSVGLVARAGDFDARRSAPPDPLVSALAGLPVALFGLQLGGLPGTLDLSTPDCKRSTWCSAWTPWWPTWPGRSGCPPGRCWPTPPTGGGWKPAPTRPGTRPCACSASRARATGSRSPKTFARHWPRWSTGRARPCTAAQATPVWAQRVSSGESAGAQGSAPG
jgi:hypothetical protein